jgi:hypothetical protein
VVSGVAGIVLRDVRPDMPAYDDCREPLVSAARTAIGDDLRSLVAFTREDHEQLYLRSDLERAALVERFVDLERP